MNNKIEAPQEICCQDESCDQIDLCDCQGICTCEIIEDEVENCDDCCCQD